MKQLLQTLFFLFAGIILHAQNTTIDTTLVQQDLNEILNDISNNYAYLNDKHVDMECIRETYSQKVSTLSSAQDVLLFFEYLLDEFYDSHMHLNANTTASYRLYSPVYTTKQKGHWVISNAWFSQLKPTNTPLIGAKITAFNGIPFEEKIDQFPTICTDKNQPEVREWIANKVLAGKYNEPRILTLQLKDKTVVKFNLDELNYKEHNTLLSTRQEKNIGIITINNSLGNNTLITAFDEALDALKNTNGLIIDLRNTVDGGNSYVAKGILSRFVDEPLPYQQHSFIEQYDNQPPIKRMWIEHVSPRGIAYTKPVILLVGRWTGSMGEGLSIGFDGTESAQIVGTEMERLCGEINGFSFINLSYGYSIPTARLFHINGTPREEYVPDNYVRQTTLEIDEALQKAFELFNVQ
tara:strand:+ start:1622 stop:2848 length:1227 start_codon:yes stop_codon:yes gene_type:complete